MTDSEKVLSGLRCPLCHKVGGAHRDPRWVNPVHEECVKDIDRWPDYAKSPLGRFGTDTAKGDHE